MSCNRCEKPYDGAPTLQNRAVMASKSKCGISPYTDPGSGICYTSRHAFDGYANPVSCSSKWLYEAVSYEGTTYQTTECTVSDGEGDGGGDCACVTDGISADDSDYDLSSEYTTATLISNAKAILGDLPEEWSDGDPEAVRDLSEDEITYSLQRAQWRVAHYPTASCYLKLWLRSIFTPEVGGSPAITDLDSYEWTGSGNPCLPDPAKGVTQPENFIVGDAIDLDEPDEDGESTVEIWKFSCLPGYVPVSLEDSGYPEP